jgi:putative signal transducing protein
MRQVYVSSYPVDADVVSTYLEANGIKAMVLNEHPASIGVDRAPTVWVVNDDDEARALRLIEERNVDRRPAPSWRCERCNESNDGDFGVCWKCGGPAPPLPR